MRMIGIILITIGLCAFSWSVVAGVLAAAPADRISIESTPVAVLYEIMLETPEAEISPTVQDVAMPTAEPTSVSIPTSTAVPTLAPTMIPTMVPTRVPIIEPTFEPTIEPTPEIEEEMPVDYGLPVSGAVLATKPISTEVRFSAGWPQVMNFEASEVITLVLTIPDSGAVSSSSSPVLSSPPTPSIGLRFLRWVFGYPSDESQGEISQVATLHCDAKAFPDHYRGFVTANLYGAAFDITPQGPQELLKKPIDFEMTSDQKLEWVWSITPKKSGRHKINLGVMAEWGPKDSKEPDVQCDVWGQVLGISVYRPLVAKGELNLGSILFIVIGSFLTAVRREKK